MKQALTALVAATAVAIPVVDTAAAATRQNAKVITVKKTVSGSQAQAQEWGYIKVTLVVKKTTTIVGKKKTVKRTIADVNVPVYPNHTNRSVFINQQALPMLVQEELTRQFAGNVNMISGATDTSDAFNQSLQAALIAAKKV
jgi:uncharacterized protein with FMN-binding domain